MKLLFNKSLYSKTAIREAIKGFEDYARLKLKTEGKYFVVEGEPLASEVETEDLEGEFCNYCLGMVVAERGQKT
jgi:hypothetical protein